MLVRFQLGRKIILKDNLSYLYRNIVYSKKYIVLDCIFKKKEFKMVTLHGIEVKVGDKVWDMLNGWTEVKDLLPNSKYCICTSITSYTQTGKVLSEHKSPTLFWNEFEIPKEAFIKPLPKLEVDTKVIVWCDDNIKHRRHFSHFDSVGRMCCFNEGTTSFTAGAFTSCWDNWELYEDNNND